ncbi:MAG TPA: hypothetical protein VJ965_09660, partial [Anaerolineales bacterium]|nr:hypothetical protein [Anaerolineales bacterium]
LVVDYNEAVEDGPYQVAHPTHVQFNMMDWYGAIWMVPVDRMAQVYDETMQVIAGLQSKIKSPPPVGTDCIDELPLSEFFHHCTHQEFLASPAKLNFVNGSGIRFVTVYGIQDFAPVDNSNLRYNFQGLTNDGQCYLSADIQIAHASLPDTNEIPQDIYTSTSVDTIAVYFGAYAQQLSQDEAGYVPTLGLFDELIESIEVIGCGVQE